MMPGEGFVPGPGVVIRTGPPVCTLDAAGRACDAVTRLFDSGEPHPEVFNLLCTMLALLDDDPAASNVERRLAFRVKLMLAAGLAPQLAACATCGEEAGLVGFSPAAEALLEWRRS